MKNKLKALGALLVFLGGFGGQDVSAVSSAELDKLIAQTDYELQFSETDVETIVQAFDSLVSVESIVDHKSNGKFTMRRLVINLEDTGSMNAFNRKCEEISANLNDQKYVNFFNVISNAKLDLNGFKEAIKRDTLHFYIIRNAAAERSRNIWESYNSGADQSELESIRRGSVVQSRINP